MVLLSCRGHQVGQDGQGHILKGDRAPVEQLQVVGPARLGQGRDLFCVKFTIIGVFDAALQLFLCIVGEEELHHLVGSLLIRHLSQFF